MGTAGLLSISPNAINSVPREASMEIDVRDTDLARRDAVMDSITKEAASIAKRRRVRHKVALINQDPPATCSPQVRGVGAQLAGACPHPHFVACCDHICPVLHGAAAGPSSQALCSSCKPEVQGFSCWLGALLGPEAGPHLNRADQASSTCAGCGRGESSCQAAETAAKEHGQQSLP